VQAAGVQFVSSWVAAVGAKTKGVYLHMLAAHLPDFIRRFGDLNRYSTQGMEHSHKQRKQYGPLGTNFKPNERGLSQVLHSLAVEHVIQSSSSTEMQREHLREKAIRALYIQKKAEKHANTLSH